MTKSEGAFERDASYITDRIVDDPNAMWPIEPGRYRLLAIAGIEPKRR